MVEYFRFFFDLPKNLQIIIYILVFMCYNDIVDIC